MPHRTWSDVVGTTDLWRKISYYICIPAVILTTLWVYKLEKAHEEHHQAMMWVLRRGTRLTCSDANGGEEPERKVYSYMNIRNKVGDELRALLTPSHSHGATSRCSST